MSTQEKTGYPSIDKPWLKYYNEEAINSKLPRMAAVEYLKEQNKNRLDLPAIDSFDGKYTYRELFKSIDQTAAALASYSLGKGDVILAMLPPMACETMLFYGVDTVGAAISFIPPSTTLEGICESIDTFNIKYMFIFDAFLTREMEDSIYKRTGLDHLVLIGYTNQRQNSGKTISWTTFLENGFGIPVPEISRDSQDLLFIAKTGGTTGKPKNVMLNDDCFNILAHQFIFSSLNYKPMDKWLRIWPIFSATAAAASNHMPLCLGMESVLRSFPLNMYDFDKLLLAEKPNHLVLIPQLIDILDKSTLIENEDLSFIKSVGCGGVSITIPFEEKAVNFFKKHHLPIFLGQGWGCTEVSSAVTIRMDQETAKMGFVGIPMVKTVISAFDPETLAELKYNEEGELCIQSYTHMMGYYDDPDLTAKVLRQHPDGTLWIHTGDLGSVDPDGFIKVSGRMTRTIFVSTGEKIFPTVLEEFIAKIPGVADVVICEAPDPEHENAGIPVCFLVADKESETDIVLSNIQEMCNASFPKYARPRRIILKQNLPLTPAGKPDIKELEAELSNL